MNLEELLALLADLGAIDSTALAELRANLVAAAADIAGTTDDDLALLERVATAVETLDVEAGVRAEAETARAAAAEALRLRIDGPTLDAAVDPATDPAADPEPTPDPEPVVASAAPVVTRIAPRRPVLVSKPIAAPARAGLSLVASANAPGAAPGSAISTYGELANLFASAYRNTGNDSYRGPAQGYVLASHTAQEGYSPERTLGNDAERNAGVLDEMYSLIASGGICVPRPVNYDLAVLRGSTARPVRDTAMMSFAADRGGVKTIVPPKLVDVAGSTTKYSNQNDIDGVVKPFRRVDCPANQETLVDGWPTRLRFGNFRQKFFPEQIQAWTDLLMVDRARATDTALIATINAGSTQTVTDQALGSSRDLRTTLIRAAVSLRNRHRLPRNFPLRFIAPEHVLGNMRADLARQQSGGSIDEQMSIADADIERWLRVDNIMVTWTPDGPTGQVYGQQGAGPLAGFIVLVDTWLYPEGSWLFLDGGELNIGLYRDSVLNGLNEVELFAETFEAAHFHGTESWKIRMELCPDGTTSAPIDFAPCLTGS